MQYIVKLKAISIILNQKFKKKLNQLTLEFKSISMTIIYLWILSNQPATLKLLKPVIDIFFINEISIFGE